MSDLLALLITEHAEGLSVHPGKALALHLRGSVQLIEGPSVPAEEVEQMLRMLAGTRQMREFRARGSASFIFTFGKSSRFRVEAKAEQDEVRFQIHTVAA